MSTLTGSEELDQITQKLLAAYIMLAILSGVDFSKRFIKMPP